MPAEELFVPGRLCLFGEHSDWAGGYRSHGLPVEAGLCLISGTEQGLRGRATRLNRSFEIWCPGPDAMTAAKGPTPRRYSIEPEALRQVARAGGFDSYAVGAAFQLIQRHEIGGLRLEIPERTLPIAKGLASSAAVCVLTARAFSRAYELELTVEEEMELAYQGEVMTGSACGRMDQACAFGRRPVLLAFDGDDMDVKPLACPAPLHILIVDLEAAKDTRRILADLNAAFVRDEGGVSAGLRRALGPENRRVVSAARSAVEAGDGEALGSLMREAQELFDRLVAPACPAELTAPKLHAVLAHPLAAATTWGGKGVGSQGDGTAQFVCRDPESRRDLGRALERDLHVSCLDLTIPACSDRLAASLAEHDLADPQG